MKAPRIHYVKNELNIIFEENKLSPIINNNNVADGLANLFNYYFIFNLQYPRNFVQCLRFFHNFVFNFEEVKNLKKTEEFLKIQNII